MRGNVARWLYARGASHVASNPLANAASDCSWRAAKVPLSTTMSKQPPLLASLLLASLLLASLLLAPLLLAPLLLARSKLPPPP